MGLSLRRKITYALVPVVVLAVTAEIGARLYAGPPLPEEGSRGNEFREFLINFAMPPEEADIVLRYDPELFWKLAPNTPDVVIHHQKSLWIEPATNSLGLRDDEIATPKPAGVVRVLCLGDSCTYGSGVVRKSSWPDLLQTRLGAGVDVVNAGVPGYTSVQAVTWLERDGLQLQPDVLVFALGFNDARSWGDLTDEEHGQRLRDRAAGLPGLLGRSRFLQVLGDWWRREHTSTAGFDVSAVNRTQRRVPEDRYRFWMQRAADDAAAHGAHILYLIWPAAGNLADAADEHLSMHQQSMRDFCAEHGLQCVDPIPALRPWKASVYLGDDLHMNQKGNTIVAWELSQRLRELGWVPR